MGAPDWLDGLNWKEVRHKDAPDEEVWAARVARERTLQLTYDEERVATLATRKLEGGNQPALLPTQVFRGDYVIGGNGKAWAVPNIVYLYTYREVN